MAALGFSCLQHPQLYAIIPEPSAQAEKIPSSWAGRRGAACRSSAACHPALLPPGTPPTEPSHMLEGLGATLCLLFSSEAPFRPELLHIIDNVCIKETKQPSPNKYNNSCNSVSKHSLRHTDRNQKVGVACCTVCMCVMM